MDDRGANRVPTTVSHYILESLLGAGGMGSVYSAVDQRDGTLVAIKLLHPHLAQDPSFKERFEREAHVAALLRSPYTVHILDYGVVERRYFIAMQYVDGQTLGQALREGPLPGDRALRIAGQVARALEEAQARGVVHRDIKPENILIWGEDNVKVSDFGIARQEGTATMTVPGAFYGTLAYAAPEQFRGEADHRSDIYALGATLYHMLAGRPPFSGSFEEIQREIIESPLPLEPLAGFDEAVVQIVSRCLEKQPDARYQGASELAAALERAARSSIAPPPEEATQRSQSATTEVLGAKAGREVISMRVGPPKVGFPFTARVRPARYEITIQNHGDEEIEVWLRTEDRGRRCRFKLPSSITVAARSPRTVLLSVRPAKRRWRGGRETRVFTVYASAGGEGPPVSVSGRFDDLPYGWVPLGGVAAAGAAAALLAGGAFAAGVVGPEPGPQPLKIGLLVPFSGHLGEAGPGYLNAARMAVAEINAGGGVNGQPVELVQADSAGEKTVSVPEAKRLIEEEGVQAIVGDLDYTSTQTIANRVTDPRRVVQVTPLHMEQGAVVDEQGAELKDSLPFLFQLTPMISVEGGGLAEIVTEGGYAKVCLVTPENTPTSPNSINPAIGDGFKQLVGDIQIVDVRHKDVASELPANAEGEIAADILSPALQANAVAELEDCAGTDLIVINTYLEGSEPEPPTSALLKEALARGLGPLVVTSTLSYDTENDELVRPPGSEGSFHVFDAIGWEQSGGVRGTAITVAYDRQAQEFNAEYEHRFGGDSKSVPYLHKIYDAVYLIALAAEKAGTTDPDAIRAAMRDIVNAPGTVVRPGPRGGFVSDVLVRDDGYLQAKELIARGEDVDFEGMAGPIEFNANGQNIRGAVEIWRVDAQARNYATERVLIVDLSKGEAFLVSQRALPSYFEAYQALVQESADGIAQLYEIYPQAFKGYPEPGAFEGDLGQTRALYAEYVPLFQDFLDRFPSLDPPPEVEELHQQTLAANERLQALNRERFVQLNDATTAGEVDAIFAENLEGSAFTVALGEKVQLCLEAERLASYYGIEFNGGCGE